MKSIAAYPGGCIVLAALSLFVMSESVAWGDSGTPARHGQICLDGVPVEVLDAMKAKAPDGKQSWKDLQGNSFKGEVAGAIGPIALFRTGKTVGRRLPLDQLSPEDCVRFFSGCLNLPVGSDWVTSRSIMAKGLDDVLVQIKDDQIVPYSLEGKPEPELFVLLYASHGVSKSWEMLGAASEQYWELKKAYGPLFEFIFIGMDHIGPENDRMAKEMHLGWPFVKFGTLSKARGLESFRPDRAPGMVIVNRHGVPIIRAAPENKEKVREILGQLKVLLDAFNPDNPQTWKARFHYLRAVQLAVHAKSKGDPIMVGSPLKADKLKEFGVTGFEATIFVDVEGRVSRVSIFAGPGIPEELVAPVSDALHQAPFVPAVENGLFVEGRYVYVFGN